MSRALSYRFATEHSVNRRNVTQAAFEKGLKYKTTSNDYMGDPSRVLYSSDTAYVAWYDPTTKNGYVSAHGLANNG